MIKLSLQKQIIQQQLSGLETKIEEIVKPPELKGIETYSPEEIVLRIVTETKPMKEDEVSRQIRKEMKAILDKNGITVYFKKWGKVKKEAKIEWKKKNLIE